MVESEFFHLSPSMISVLKASNEMDSTLLITGSTGSGKSHLAYSIYKVSHRGHAKWYKINLATLSENLIESELFGHERGAFTGAETRRIGRLELCHNGTVFLDEIGELSPRLQAKLLDFIQYKRIIPVGSNREIEVNVRVIAATNRKLEAAVRAGEFRVDLFHRLNVFHVRLPDLSLHPRSVRKFAHIFLMQTGIRSSKKISTISRTADYVLKNYPWPGNLRELENAIEYAMAMEESAQLMLESFPKAIQEFAKENLKLDFPPEVDANDLEEESEKKEELRVSLCNPNAVGFLELPVTYNFHETRESFERAYLEQALRWCGGQLNLTSRRIGLNKVSLGEKIRKFGIDWRKIRYESGNRDVPEGLNGSPKEEPELHLV